MILSVTLPFFALILFGYIAAARRWVPVEAVPAFNGFLLYFAVPAMLFRFAANTSIDQLTNLRFTLAWAACGVSLVLLVAYLSKRLFGATTRDAAFYGLAGGVGNLGFMGVPMLVALLGEGAAAALIIAILVDNIVIGSVGLALAESGGTRQRGVRSDLGDAVGRIFLNPFIVSMLLGAAFSAFSWELPVFAASIVKLLADSAGPCALFAIGVSLMRTDAPLKSPILALPLGAKLLLHPLLVWGAMYAFGVDPYTTLVAILAAGLPVAGWVFIFATRYEADAGRVSAAILLSTAIAFVTFSSLMWMLGVGR